MPREVKPPVVGDDGAERHPAFGMVGVTRSQNSPPGATLFDSDIQHGHTVHLQISTASRRRDLNRDWLYAEREFIEIEMSEAQWASFVSSMGVGGGVPCTIRRREDDYMVPGLPYEPRLAESMAEVERAADKAVAAVAEAFAAYETKKNAENLRTLKYAIKNLPSNLTYAAKSLSEHGENVTQRIRADVEAMVVHKAEQLGLEPSALGVAMPQLERGES